MSEALIHRIGRPLPSRRHRSRRQTNAGPASPESRCGRSRRQCWRAARSRATTRCAATLRHWPAENPRGSSASVFWRSSANAAAVTDPPDTPEMKSTSPARVTSRLPLITCVRAAPSAPEGKRRARVPPPEKLNPTSVSDMPCPVGGLVACAPSALLSGSLSSVAPQPDNQQRPTASDKPPPRACLAGCSACRKSAIIKKRPDTFDGYEPRGPRPQPRPETASRTCFRPRAWSPPSHRRPAQAFAGLAGPPPGSSSTTVPAGLLFRGPALARRCAGSIASGEASRATLAGHCGHAAHRRSCGAPRRTLCSGPRRACADACSLRRCARRNKNRPVRSAAARIAHSLRSQL